MKEIVRRAHSGRIMHPPSPQFSYEFLPWEGWFQGNSWEGVENPCCETLEIFDSLQAPSREFEATSQICPWQRARIQTFFPAGSLLGGLSHQSMSKPREALQRWLPVHPGGPLSPPFCNVLLPQMDVRIVLNNPRKMDTF